jgi:hypothetical protein
LQRDFEYLIVRLNPKTRSAAEEMVFNVWLDVMEVDLRLSRGYDSLVGEARRCVSAGRFKVSDSSD